MKNDRIAVIKTGWCHIYDGDDAAGDFGYLADGGAGAERFNMRPCGERFEVYALPKAKDGPPAPTPMSGWMIVHVARDPAEGRMKIVGWYEDATFLTSYAERDKAGGVDRSIYCIDAKHAFGLIPADRPIIDHDGRFGSSGIFWLRGNASRKGKKSWEPVTLRIEQAVSTCRNKTLTGAELARKNVGRLLGDTRTHAKSSARLDTDDGGVPYGRSSESESPEHKALRKWAERNGLALTGDKKIDYSKTEHPLPSGDRVDAFHRSSKAYWLIEAKSRRSGEADIERGIYQCVKYRAVTEAIRKNVGENWKVHSILLTEAAISVRLQVLAKRHGVVHVVHRC